MQLVAAEGIIERSSNQDRRLLAGRMYQINDEFAQALRMRDFDAADLYNYKLHGLLFDGAHSPILQRIRAMTFAVLPNPQFRFWQLITESDEALERVISEHTDIADAIDRGEFLDAAAVISKHGDEQIRRLAVELGSQQSSNGDTPKGH